VLKKHCRFCILKHIIKCSRVGSCIDYFFVVSFTFLSIRRGALRAQGGARAGAAGARAGSRFEPAGGAVPGERGGGELRGVSFADRWKKFIKIITRRVHLHAVAVDCCTDSDYFRNEIELSSTIPRKYDRTPLHFSLLHNHLQVLPVRLRPAAVLGLLPSLLRPAAVGLQPAARHVPCWPDHLDDVLLSANVLMVETARVVKLKST